MSDNLPNIDRTEVPAPVEAEIVVAEPVVLMDECPRCGRKNVEPASKYGNKHICRDCEKAENSRIMYTRNHQPDWPQIASDNGLELWERQPGETVYEYSIWQTYRDMYPASKPNYKEVAKKLNTTHDAVKKAAARWTFNTRLQAWIAHCDELTLKQRHDEILNMNKEHIDMAQALRDKLKMAIDMIDVASLKPSDLNSLLKTATELEKRARVDTVAQEEVRNMLVKDTGNPELQKTQTKTEDLGEVVKILMNAGLLGDVAQAGIRKTTTTTTEIVVKDSNDNSAALVSED